MNHTIKTHIQSFLAFQWVKRFLYWLVVSAGTISECVFLIASIWISLNATVHPLMLKLMSEGATVTLSQLAISAFTSLPEIILGLATVTVYGHIKSYCLDQRIRSLVWAVLFGLPTLVFASLTIWTLAASALQIGYVMPPILVALRALTGYLYGFLSMLFVLIGKPDQADYVEGLKADIARLKDDMAMVKSHYEDRLSDKEAHANFIWEHAQTQIEELQNQLQNQKEESLRLSERACSLVSEDLASYPKIVSELLDKGVKTVSIDELAVLTGHSRRRLNAAKLQRHSRNHDLVLVSSAIEWLKTAPKPESQKPLDVVSNGHAALDGDTPPYGLPLMTIE
jgi:hypothetical protein